MAVRVTGTLLFATAQNSQCLFHDEERRKADEYTQSEKSANMLVDSSMTIRR